LNGTKKKIKQPAKTWAAFKDAKFVFADPFSISRDDFTAAERKRYEAGTWF